MNTQQWSLEGRAAIVTGSRRGIGAAIALALADAGADVAVCDLVTDDGALDAVITEIKKLGRRALSMKVDVTDRKNVDAMVNKARQEFGFVDILVNNAGGHRSDRRDNAPRIEFHETPEQDWDTDFAANFKGTFHFCQAVIGQMIERKKGSIVNISSIAAERRGVCSAYHVAKAAVNRLTVGLAHDLGKHNIRVNAIEPGMTRTELVRRVWSKPDVLQQQAALYPLGRIADPQDIANLALFLASDASSFITGEVIVADGGFLLPHTYEVPDLLDSAKKHNLF